MKLRFRPSVRAMMALVLVMAIVLAWVVNGARTQRLAVEAIERSGGVAFYEWDIDPVKFPTREPAVPEWLVKRLGVDYFGPVREVRLFGPKANDEVMRYVGRLNRISHLFLAGTGVTDAGLAPIRGLSRLDSLDLDSNPSIKGPGLANLQELAGLRELDLESDTIDDADLAPVGRLAGLARLDLSGCPITDSGLGHLRGLTSLSILKLDRTRITDLSPIAGLNNLTSLGLATTPITDAGLAPIPSFPRLVFLSVHDTKITDAGLVPLGRSPSLEDMSLTRTHITDAGLRHLASLKTLRRLGTLETERTDAGLAELQESLPDLDIDSMGRRCGPVVPHSPNLPEK